MRTNKLAEMIAWALIGLIALRASDHFKHQALVEEYKERLRNDLDRQEGVR